MSVYFVVLFSPLDLSQLHIICTVCILPCTNNKLLSFGKQIHLPDYLKAELFPHHMGRVDENSYHSSSILGLIYDRVQEFQNGDVPGKGQCSYIPSKSDNITHIPILSRSIHRFRT